MTKEEFTVLFRYLSKETGYSDKELAKELQVSRPTIERWRNGDAAPHLVGRKPIIAYLIAEQIIHH